ncbi:MAG: hypothetical protein NDJ90_09990 [Oligoflexia bacterium]|nr:hypothetical protein [Oligoflexia bacterium]
MSIRTRLLNRFFALAGVALALNGCSAPVETGSDPVGKQAILDWVDIALSGGDCATAVAKIKPLYESPYSDNEVRMKAASAYACYAGVNFFQTVMDIEANSGDMLAGLGEGFWPTMSKLFPSQGAGLDYRVEGAVLAIDALQAALSPGIALLPSNTINPGGYNEGSVFATDRISDSNIFMIFNAMAAIGTIQSRYGVPDAGNGYKKTALLPWKTATSIGLDGDGCAYVSALMNLIDALGATAGSVPANLSTTLTTVHDTLDLGVSAACVLGCKGLVPPAIAPLNPRSQWVNSGCNAAVTDCARCPDALRDRTKCLRANDDVTSCAAAGIINFINSSDNGWLGP